MATDTYWQLEHEYYTIATGHDLIVRVIEHEDIERTEGEGIDAKIVSVLMPALVTKLGSQDDIDRCYHFGFQKRSKSCRLSANAPLTLR